MAIINIYLYVDDLVKFSSLISNRMNCILEISKTQDDPNLNQPQ